MRFNVAVAAAVLIAVPSLTMAKLPPLSDDAKAKAAEAAAKTAHANKVAAYQLCQAQDKAVAEYVADAKKAGRDAKPGSGSAPCADPGPFAAPAATPAPAAAPAKKS